MYIDHRTESEKLTSRALALRQPFTLTFITPLINQISGSTAVWTNLIRNWEADRARDKSIASERSVGGIANRVNGHGTATSLL